MPRSMTAGHRSIVTGPTTIEIVRDASLDQQVVEELVAFLSEQEGPWSFVAGGDIGSTGVRGDGPADWEALFSVLSDHRRERGIDAERVLILLTSRPNRGNWFSATSPDDARPRDVFIQASDWEWITSAPLPAFLGYQVVQNLLVLAALEPGEDLMDLVHEREPRGCVADFAENKAEFSLQLRTADICGDCLERLDGLGPDERVVSQAVSILEACRRLAVSTSRYLRIPRRDTALPFPVAVTRHKATTGGAAFERFRRLLDHSESLVRHSCLFWWLLRGDAPDVPDRPSAGWWMERLQEVGRADASVRRAWRAADEARVVKLRNDVAHGQVPEARLLAQMTARLEQALSEMEAGLRPLLLSADLVRYEGCQIRDGAYVLRLQLLRGSNPLFESEERALPPGTDPVEAGMLRDGLVGLLRAGEPAMIDAERFLRMTNCPTCDREQLLSADGVHWHDLAAGHRVLLRD